jgi:DNA-binding Lrp family transcriptional regulator
MIEPIGTVKKGGQVAQNMPEAFVLFKTEPSREREVYISLTENDSVAEVHALYGEYDLLVRVSIEDEKNLTSMLMREFRQIQGVRETQTLIAVDY